MVFIHLIRPSTSYKLKLREKKPSCGARLSLKT